MLHKSFKPVKCKTSLKLAMARLKLMKNKRDAAVKHLRRELAQLLESGQEQTARLRVEHVIREEKAMSAYELIELYCELIVARLQIIESQKSCPNDLKEAISSIIFASPRCADVPELTDVRKHFSKKYGKEFVTAATELRPNCGVNIMIVEKLSAKTPGIQTVVKTLNSVALEYGIKWESKSFEDQIQKPREDFLSGPQIFGSTNNITPESAKSYHSFQGTSKYESPKRSSEHCIEGSVASLNQISGGAAYGHPNIVQESKHVPSEIGHPDVKDHAVHPTQQKWSMEFKDAASAAQAAAESAERASLAARAAAELASHGNDSWQHGNQSVKAAYDSHEEVPWRSINLKSENWTSVAKAMQMDDEERKELQRLKQMENQQRDGAIHDRISEQPERTQNDFQSGDITSRSSSSIHNIPPANDAYVQRSSHVQYADNQNLQQKKIAKDDLVGEGQDDHVSDGNISPADHQIGHDDLSRRTFYDEDIMNMSVVQKTKNSGLEEGRDFERDSNKNSFRSTECAVEDHLFSELNYQKIKNLSENTETSHLPNSFEVNDHAVFDESDSDNDDVAARSFFQEHESSASNLPSNADPSKQYRAGSSLTSSSSIPAHPIGKQQIAESFDDALESPLASKPDFSIPAFDVSDMSSEENLDKDTFSQKEFISTENSSLLPSEHEFRDFEFPNDSDSSDEDSQALRIENLKGGLRNKRFSCPSHIKTDGLPLSSKENSSESFVTQKQATLTREKSSTISEDLDLKLNSEKRHVRPYISSPGPFIYSQESNISDSENLQSHNSLQSRGHDSDESYEAEELRINTANIPDKKEKVRSMYKANQDSSNRVSQAAAPKDSDRLKQFDFLDERGNVALPKKYMEDSTLATGKPSFAKCKESSRPLNSKVELSDQESNARTQKKSGLKYPVPYFDSDSDDFEELQPRLPPVTRVSRRTRNVPIVSNVNVASEAREQTHVPSTANMQRIPLRSGFSSPKPVAHEDKSEQVDYSRFPTVKPSIEEPLSVLPKNNDLGRVGKSLRHNSIQTFSSDHKEPSRSSGLTSKSSESSDNKWSSNSLSPMLSVEQPPLPILHSEGSAKESLSSSRRGSTRTVPSEETETRKLPTVPTTDGPKGSTHVHPKLPDYDTLAAHFQSLRSNRRQ